VTNLYSSAVFVGWVAAGCALYLERVSRRGLAAAVGGAAGFATLLVAHHLAASGDTLEMMQAVLDSNFWLGTHVVTITIGYAGTFLAGLLAHLWVLKRWLGRLDEETGRQLYKMTYGTVCFALFFSFIGTVLGGIWADQSWGRFWGWDPKENGALLIVLWNALILHARWGGQVRERGFMIMAVFGNIITSLSWFGVNMLGIGLHSYGFMDAAFWWLTAWTASQLALMLLGWLPPRFWTENRA
jgi:ABC-type transport system involved in cytochrome c biogenesis permease subunit